MHVQIEGRVYNELVYGFIIPAAVAYQNTLISNVSGLKEIYGAAHKKYSEGQLSMIEEIAEHLVSLKSGVDAMTEARKKANLLKDTKKKAEAYCTNVKPYFDDIRQHSDKLEKIIDNQLWPLTKYRELLLSK
jgi:glutamine synthetase